MSTVLILFVLLVLIRKEAIVFVENKLLFKMEDTPANKYLLSHTGTFTTF